MPLPQPRAHLRRVCAVLFCLGMLLVCGPALRAQVAGDTTYALHGQVVNGVTGAPLARALVTSADRRLATMTDGEGRFAIKLNVPARSQGGPVNLSVTRGDASGGPGATQSFRSSGPLLLLMAQKPGFLGDGVMASVSINDALNTTDVVLRLMPAASISGRVSADGTDLASDVQLQLLRHQPVDGQRIWQVTGAAQTDSRGEFRFSNLRPGEYTVMTSTWRGDVPFSRQTAEVARQYPPVFYGDVADLGSSTKLHLKLGDASQVELHLHQVNFYRVTVPFTAGPGRPAGISARLAGNQSFSGYNFSFNARDGAVEGALPNGSYNLTLSSFGQAAGFAEVAVHVSGAPVTTAPAALSPAGTVAVQPQWELSQTQGSPSLSMNVRLQPEDHAAGGAFGNSRPGTGNDFAIENVQPGSYRVYPQPSTGYVAAMTCGGVDLLQQPLTVGTGGTRDPIEVTVRDDTGELSGKITGIDSPPRGGMAMLLPMDEAGRLSFGNIQPDGGYQIANIPPGSYRLLAGVGEIWQIAYRDEQAMRSLDGKGQVVLVKAGGKGSADAPWVGDLDASVP